MHNQHAGLSHQLAAQRIAERQEEAAQARLAHSAGRSRRRHHRWLTRRWWQLVRRPGAVRHRQAGADTLQRAPAPVPRKPSGQLGRLGAWLGGLVAALLLAGGLVVPAARKTRRRLGSSTPPDHETHHRRKTMSKPTRRRRAACRAAARTLAIAAAIAALTATLSAGQALAGPDERVLERQGRIDHQAATAQADEQGKAEKPSPSSTAQFARRHLRPEPPMGSESWVDDDGSLVPAPAPKAPAHDRDSLAVAAAAVALLLGLGAAATWRIHRQRPRPEPTT